MSKVLIVDDAAFMRVTLKNMLEKNGFDVIGEAVDGEDAVRKYFELKPDLVTMDITMPNMDGIEALKNIRSADNGANVIICSAMGQKGMIIDAIENGARDFVVKPFKEDRVVEAFNKILQ